MPLEPGALIGPYEVVGWLGRGGMGEVYHARDGRLHRDVAIKVLPERFAAEARRLRRFEQEARAAGQLNHPNILSVYDVGRHDGSPFVVAELLEGETLRARLTRGAMPARKAIDLARQLADGLAAAHDKGIVHRDIKPENLFLTSEGRVKILDFGIAKLTTDDEAAGAELELITETDPGSVLGTSGYMSPEQVRADTVDPRSDLFSAGAVLHEMLTGRSAFLRATHAETAVAILKEEPAALPAEVPDALGAIVMRCLEKNREARFQSARDLAFSLQQLPMQIPDRVPASIDRRIVAGLAVVAVMGAAIAGAAWVASRFTVGPTPFEERFANATFTRFTNWDGTEGMPAISADGRFVAFLADRAGPVDLWISQVGTSGFRNLTSGSISISTPGPPLRTVQFAGDDAEIWLGMSTNRLVPIAGGTIRNFLGGQRMGAVWSPDGTRLAFFKNAPTNPEFYGDPLFVAEPTGANERLIFVRAEQGVHTHNPIWSPDGQWIYFVHGRSVGQSFEMDFWRIRPSGDALERLTTLETDLDFFAMVDERTLVFVARAPDRSGPWLWALDVPSRRIRRLVSGLEQYRSVSASRDGRRLVATVASPAVALTVVPIGDRVAEEDDITAHAMLEGSAQMPRFGRSSLFYLAGLEGRRGLWRLKDGQSAELWRGVDGAIFDPPAISADEERVAFVRHAAGRPQVTIMAADGTGVRGLVPSLEPLGTVDWSPDGMWIVVAGRREGAEGLFKVRLADESVEQLAEGTAGNPIWSPLGDLIVYTGPIVGGVSTLRAVRPSGEPVPLPEIRVRPGGHRFMPDGRGVVYQATALDFHQLDLTTGATRQLTRFDSNTALMAGRTFDISPDGTQLVFDRARENADIVLIELPE